MNTDPRSSVAAEKAGGQVGGIAGRLLRRIVDLARAVYSPHGTIVSAARHLLIVGLIFTGELTITSGAVSAAPVTPARSIHSVCGGAIGDYAALGNPGMGCYPVEITIRHNGSYVERGCTPDDFSFAYSYTFTSVGTLMYREALSRFVVDTTLSIDKRLRVDKAAGHIKQFEECKVTRILPFSKKDIAWPKAASAGAGPPNFPVFAYNRAYAGSSTQVFFVPLGGRFLPEVGKQYRSWCCSSVMARGNEPESLLSAGLNITQKDVQALIDGRSLRVDLSWSGEAQPQTWYENDLQIVIAIAGRPGVLAVSPEQDFNPTGPDKDGKVTPSSKTYTLKNVGGAAIDYKLSHNEEWISLSNAGGTLEAGASETVSVRINKRAKELKGTTHSDTVSFNNTTSGRGSATRRVTLAMEERWRVIYSGYTVFFHELKSEVAGGARVHWRTVVEFVIKNGEYSRGRATNHIGRSEPYSTPSGVWDCIRLEGFPRILRTSYAVPGQKSGNRVRLKLPSDNDFLDGLTCILNSDQLKAYLRDKGYKTFPSLKTIDLTKTMDNLLGEFPKGFHDISLQEYTKVMESDRFQGYRVEVRKIR